MHVEHLFTGVGGTQQSNAEGREATQEAARFVPSGPAPATMGWGVVSGGALESSPRTGLPG